jgi:acetyl esterase/lipase
MGAGMSLPSYLALPVALSIALGTVANSSCEESRMPPPPAGASAELQKILSETPPPDAYAAMVRVQTTVEAWKELVAQDDAISAKVAEAYAKEASVSIEEASIEGVRVHRLSPAQVAPEHAGHLFVYLHAGGFIWGGGMAGLLEAAAIAAKIGIPVLSIDYRLAPDYPAPAALEDIIAVWRSLIKERPSKTMALGGSSAGGNLTLVAALRMKELGLELPAALFVGTPVVDLAKRGDSRFINDGLDQDLVNWEVSSPGFALYVRDKSRDDPHISPIFGDFKGFPPTYLISGTRDLMLSDTVRAHRKLRQAGAEADLHVYEGHSHYNYVGLLGTPESDEHFKELDAFLQRHLAK